MQSQYGVPEIQQFVADGGCAPVFSISIADMPTSSQQPQKQHHHAHHLHQQQQQQQEAQRQHHHHRHLHLHHHHFPQMQLQQPVPLPPPQAIHHFQPIPVTQQLFQDGHQFHLFQQEQQRRIHQQLVQLGLEIESGPENSSSPTRIIASAASGGGGIPPFLGGGANFRLVVNQSGGGGGGSRDRLNDEEAVILHGDEGSETHIHPWGTREDDSGIKESLWRPLDVDYINRNNKRCKEKQLEPSNSGKHCKSSKEADNTDDGSNSAASNYKLFSELEAIYKPVNGGGGNSAGGANNNQQTGSGSALTVENPPATADAPRADWDGHNKDDAADQGSDTSTGEEAAQVEKPNKSNGGRRKRKRKQQQLSSIVAFVENLVKRLVEHQEGLHRKFLEVIVRRDQESMNQEEMWRQKEVAKASREAMARAEEQALASTREAAIVSFLEKITGESLSLPTRDQFQSRLPEESSQKEGIKGIEYQSDLACAVVAAADDGNTDVNPTANADTAGIVNPSRWPKVEVQALIRVRSSLESRFQEPGLKGPLWEEVSSTMAAMGYHRSAKRCKEKWENINKYFRKTKDSPKKRSQHSKTCPYFHQLDQLYSKSLNKGTLAAGAVSAPPSSTVTSSRWNNSEHVDSIVKPSEQTAGSFRFSDVDTARLEFLNKDDDDNQEASGSATAGQRDEEGGEEEADAEEEGESQEEAVGNGGHGDWTEHDRSPRDAAVFFRRLES